MEPTGGVTLARRFSLKTGPLAVCHNMGVERHDCEGRVLAGWSLPRIVVSVYVPNAKRDLSRLADRQDWDTGLLAYLKDSNSTNL